MLINEQMIEILVTSSLKKINSCYLPTAKILTSFNNK